MSTSDRNPKVRTTMKLANRMKDHNSNRFSSFPDTACPYFAFLLLTSQANYHSNRCFLDRFLEILHTLLLPGYDGIICTSEVGGLVTSQEVEEKCIVERGFD